MYKGFFIIAAMMFAQSGFAAAMTEKKMIETCAKECPGTTTEEQAHKCADNESKNPKCHAAHEEHEKADHAKKGDEHGHEGDGHAHGKKKK